MAKLSIRTLLALGVVVTLGAGKGWADTVTFNNSAANVAGSVTIGSTITLTGGTIDVSAHTGFLGALTIGGTCGGGTAGCISLTTGAFIGANAGTSANDYTYAGGGSISIVGTIPSLGINVPTTLFSSNFDAGSPVTLTFDDTCPANPTAGTQCTGTIQGTLAAGLLNSAIATQFGVSPTTTGGEDQNLFFSFTGALSTSGATAPSGSASGNTNQLQVITPGGGGSGQATVPEPGSLILLGTGLVGAARFARRRIAK